MDLPEPVENALDRGRRNVLRLQALSLLGYFLFGPGLLLLSLDPVGLPPPARWVLRGLGGFVTLLMIAAAAQTYLRLRAYRAVADALRNGSAASIQADLDMTPFRRVVIPKVRLRLADRQVALYLLDERSAAALVEHFRKGETP
jgi:hypothetical protein